MADEYLLAHQAEDLVHEGSHLRHAGTDAPLWVTFLGRHPLHLFREEPLHDLLQGALEGLQIL